MSRRRWSPLVLLMVVFLVVCGGSDADDPFDIEDETPDPPPADTTTEGTGLYAVDPLSVSTDPWAGMVPQIDPWFELPNIPVDQMRVLEIPAQITGWEDNVDVVNSLCHTWG